MPTISMFSGILIQMFCTDEDFPVEIVPAIIPRATWRVATVQRMPGFYSASRMAKNISDRFLSLVAITSASCRCLWCG